MDHWMNSVSSLYKNAAAAANVWCGRQCMLIVIVSTTTDFAELNDLLALCECSKPYSWKVTLMVFKAEL